MKNHGAVACASLASGTSCGESDPRVSPKFWLRVRRRLNLWRVSSWQRNFLDMTPKLHHGKGEYEPIYNPYLSHVSRECPRGIYDNIHYLRCSVVLWYPKRYSREWMSYQCTNGGIELVYHWYVHLGVSQNGGSPDPQNGGSPKWIVYNGKSY